MSSALYLLLLAIFFIEVSQTLSCPCDDPQPSTLWGNFEITSECTGPCYGIEVGKSLCHWNIKGVVQPTETCIRSRDCYVEEGCTGTWSTWIATTCDSLCTYIQRRYCYQVGPSLQRIPSTLCIGSKGKSEQKRTRSCISFGCKPSATAVLPNEINVTQLGSVISETSPSYTTGSLMAVIITGVTTSSRNEGLEGVDEKDQPGFDNVTLPVILGSIAIICVTIIAIVVAVLRNRRRNPRTDYPSYNSTVPVMEPASPIRNHNYATVGPALPDRPPPRNHTRDQTPSSPDHPTIVENSLYQPMVFEDKRSTSSSSMRTDEVGYLLPLPSSSTTSDVDPNSVYSTIDGNR